MKTLFRTLVRAEVLKSEGTGLSVVACCTAGCSASLELFEVEVE